jgi:TPR repeat protein
MVTTTMAKHVNLRHLTVAIFIGLSAAGAAHAKDPSTTTPGQSTPDTKSGAVTASALAAAYLEADSLPVRLKALDVLASCDKAMNPLCRVDMGLAYGLLAQEPMLDPGTRGDYADNARTRLRQAANLGNQQARAMIDTLGHLAEGSIDTFARGQGTAAATRDSVEGARLMAPTPISSSESVAEELQVVRMELEEARRTIEILQAQLAEQHRLSFDPIAANRQALAAALNGDYETAIPLFRKAAEADNSGAQNNLAVLYVNGSGVPRDIQQALSLFERAATLGNVESAENAARIYKYGIGRPKDPSRARAWYRRAVQLGSSSATHELAAMEDAIAVGRYF